MASKYYYRRLDVEAGPVGFPYLVSLIRDGQLTADDGVRPEWEEGWRPADSIVGLFRMAKRADVLARWEAEQAAKAGAATVAKPTAPDFEPPVGNNFDEVLSKAESVAESVPSWQLRLRDVMALRFLGEKDESEAKSQGSVWEPRIRNAISSAVEALDQKEVKGRSGKIRRNWDVVRSPEVLHGFFRIALTLVAANFAGIAVASWSEVEAQRYPSKQQQVLVQRKFPLWGECSEFEYRFLFVDVVVIAGLFGYCGGRLLESKADD